MKGIYFFLGLSLFLISCNEKEKNTLFELKDNRKTGINHVNTIESSKELNVFKYRNFYNGGGVGLGDINNDGLIDIYFTINRSDNKLYLNKGNLEFEDITNLAGVAGTKPWSTGVSMIDINSDGNLDIYVSNAGIDSGSSRDNELFINQGDGTFKEEAEKYNLANTGITTHASFIDFDLDGDLDVYILNNSFIPVTTLGYNNKRGIKEEDWNINDEYKGGGDKFFENQNGKFVDVTENAGIYNSLIGFGLGVTSGDINKDGYPDLYISNDFYERDYLYINQRDGTFKEELEDWVNHISHSSMGSDLADINNDGYLDIFVTDMLPEDDRRLKETTEYEGVDVYELKQKLGFYHQFMQNSLQINNKNNSFSEVAFQKGVAATDWSWGALMFDMDLDGSKDIFVANGIYHELTNQDFMNYFANDVIQNMDKLDNTTSVIDIVNKMPSRPISNYSFKNNKISFENKTKEWGLDKKSFSNGSAYGDLDNDGDLDLVINNVNQPVFIYENKSIQKGANYISIELKSKSKNAFAIGSKVYLYVKDTIQFAEIYPARGFQSSVDYKINFGLGKNTEIDSLNIIWPDQTLQSIKKPKINKTHLIIKDSVNQKLIWKNTIVSETSFKPIKNLSINDHRENVYSDYDNEVTIPESLSREGPGIAVGDVNKDGLDDIFIGNGAGFASELYLQKSTGSFVLSNSSAFNEFKSQEDVAAKFIDLDMDGDLDLYVGTGGNERSKSPEHLNDRIYINDGYGNFKFKENALPSFYTNTSVIATNDFDLDGDIDIFIGNRAVSGMYGITPNSVFLQNDGNAYFTNVTDMFGGEAKDTGMVTDAIWINLTSNNTQDLLIVGDWFSPTFFKNNGYYLEKYSTKLDSLNGWWNTIIKGDINNDGLTDFILGNKGDNNAFIGTKESKASLYINDFDENGSLDQIPTKQINGSDYPILVKKEIQHQLTYLKKENTSYEVYAKKNINELLTDEKINTSIIKFVNESKSMIAIQNKNRDFDLKPLSHQVQRNSVNTGILEDFNDDGNLDLLLFGGTDHLKPQFSKQDAGFGEYLIGDGIGDFKWQSYDISGFKVRGVVKKALKVKTKEGSLILLGKNNESPELYIKNEN